MVAARFPRPFVACLALLLGLARVVAAEDVLSGLDFGALSPREVRVYRPEGPLAPDIPVLVALDGQSLGAWHVADALAAAAAAGRRPPLVVAIAAGPDRLEEYGLADQPDFAGRGRRAAELQRFIIGAVLPAVRARYGVRAEAAHTGVMGASLGGLAAFDLAWRHADVFGFAGVFSGALWWRGDDATPAARQASRLVHRLVRETTTPPRLRLWFEAGTRDETSDRDGNGVIDAVQDTTELVALLEQCGFRRDRDVTYVEVAGGEHNEATWGRALPAFLEWSLPAAGRP